jgi:hypothetical protein
LLTNPIRIWRPKFNELRRACVVSDARYTIKPMTDTPYAAAGRRSQGRLWLGLWLTSALVLLGFLLTFELLFGRWGHTYFPPRSATVDRSFVNRQDLYEPFGEVHYSRDKYGLRNPHGRLDSIRVVTVGGSTTDQRYIADGETWQDVLQASTGLQVANAGVDGISSRGHIVAVNEWLHRIADLRPAAYIHYIGINDAEMVWHAPSLARYDRSSSDADWSVQIQKRSALFHLVRQLTARPEKAEFVGHSAIKASNTNFWKRAEGEFDEVRRYVEQQYRPNLRTLVALHGARHERIILASQPLNPALVQWRSDGLFVSGGPNVERLALSLTAVNSTTRDLCRTQVDICTFADIASAQFVPTDFYDAVHMTPHGAAKLGHLFAGYFTR